jgi:hypothetical protein
MSDAIRVPWSPLARVTAIIGGICTVGSVIMVALFLATS